ncbi:MAG: histidine kinase dimerization/phospho-acceptor domain-containing protein [Thermodesulfovibrionales bacterium]|nr:histidine kinase dimerization/phospho-acceptor domain-containing protein [Thermodesulfovibrionales bacterium]
MGHNKRYEKVRFLFLKKRFYLGLFILLPAFFCLFSLGAFFLVFAKLEPLRSLTVIDGGRFRAVYGLLENWAYAFTAVALFAGIIVAYALLRPAKRMLKEQRADVDEFGSLGNEFRDMAASLRQHVAALESITGGVITANKDGVITMANRQAFEMLSSGGKELPSTDIRELFLLGDKLGKVLAGAAAVTSEVDALTSSGLRPMECTISPIRGKRGVEGAVFNFRDISKIREMHEELARTGRLAGIGSLAMSVAHEVRNPLTSIKGFAQLIAEDMKEDDPRRLYLDTILKEADRLNRVVDNLYEMRDSRFEGETLGETLRRARLLCDQAMKEKNVRATEHYDEQAASYEVKDEGIFNGIYNVVLNAYEAVTEGGSVDITAASSGSGAVVDVASSSVLKDGMMERIFLPDVTTKGKGRGAGLKIARDALRQAGGDIDARMENGKTVFRIWLP